MILGYILGAMQPETFRHTHGYFEVALLVGLLAAIGYTVRLWPYRTDRRLKVPLRINLCFIALFALVLILAGAQAIFTNLGRMPSESPRTEPAEQGVAPNRLLAPSQKLTSSIRGSEDF